jgi:hypothetical protein
VARPLPGLVTGTSSEYLGTRPLRRILRERSVVIVTGPVRSGKSSVARKIASWPSHAAVLHLDSKTTHAEAVRFARQARWSEAVRRAPALVLDGPENLRNCRGVFDALVSLIQQRQAAGLRTVVVDPHNDGSADVLMAAMATGSTALLALRMPAGQAGRRRWARRMCDELGLSRALAQGTATLEPWGYEAVLDWLRQQVPKAAQG